MDIMLKSREKTWKRSNKKLIVPTLSFSKYCPYYKEFYIRAYENDGFDSIHINLVVNYKDLKKVWKWSNKMILLNWLSRIKRRISFKKKCKNGC